jgi:hypothetical protein
MADEKPERKGMGGLGKMGSKMGEKMPGKPDPAKAMGGKTDVEKGDGVTTVHHQSDGAPSRTRPCFTVFRRSNPAWHHVPNAVVRCTNDQARCTSLRM